MLLYNMNHCQKASNIVNTIPVLRNLYGWITDHQEWENGTDYSLTG